MCPTSEADGRLGFGLLTKIVEVTTSASFFVVKDVQWTSISYLTEAIPKSSHTRH
jgi:hypothetical protein